ncbi:hypothetical protein EJ08DRAFT_155624 [Tothia fuscella]|uniref:Uncharacterized protein n=1 Tax=Tothia fuscella TaxID=1048955 RepID=A0A9P4P3M9_9PEZI|nr:hypothetical protein EJ08DRAFT_155624 [Tothia fuscella]
MLLHTVLFATLGSAQLLCGILGCTSIVPQTTTFISTATATIPTTVAATTTVAPTQDVLLRFHTNAQCTGNIIESNSGSGIIRPGQCNNTRSFFADSNALFDPVKYYKANVRNAYPCADCTLGIYKSRDCKGVDGDVIHLPIPTQKVVIENAPPTECLDLNVKSVEEGKDVETKGKSFDVVCNCQ